MFKSEGLGGGIGPHFWITPDDLNPVRVQHLKVNYNIHTIHFDNQIPFSQRVYLANRAIK